jgi:hypothetical protein
MTLDVGTETIAIPPNSVPSARSAAAERMRAHRERRRMGLRCVPVQLREKEIDVLIRKGLLKGDARNDVYAIRDAVHAYLDHTLSKAL